ncbi:MAG TPA: acyl-CoA thioesterase [Candidatus Krumholzibacteria bacterium]|nr:acyl-CoA thioesterase [Candidatus Krumholzibacteria bacterium]
MTKAADERDARIQSRIDTSETRIAKVVVPSTTNHYDTLFGGTLLGWMDEVAFITATRFGRCRFVTVSLDRTDFKQPIPSGTIVELIGRVEHLGRTSVRVRVDVWVEQMLALERFQAATGEFTMVAIDDHKHPAPVVI